MARQPLPERIGQIFAEEGDIWLHDARDRDLVVRFFVVRAVFVLFALLFEFVRLGGEPAVAAFALDATRRLGLTERLDAALAARDAAGFQVVIDCRAGYLVFAF